MEQQFVRRSFHGCDGRCVLCSLAEYRIAKIEFGELQEVTNCKYVARKGYSNVIIQRYSYACFRINNMDKLKLINTVELDTQGINRNPLNTLQPG